MTTWETLEHDGAIFPADAARFLTEQFTVDENYDWDDFFNWDERSHLGRVTVDGDLIAVSWAIEHPQHDALYIRYVCVRAGNRGSGVGTNLIYETASKAVLLGLKKLTLQVLRGDDDVQRRIAWFARLGFGQHPDSDVWTADARRVLDATSGTDTCSRQITSGE